MDNVKICIVGLGYVGLPLAVLLDKKYKVIGFDINPKRVEELKNNYDRTREVSQEELKNCNIEFTDNPQKISEANVIIITVPTPIDEHNIPDLKPIKSVTRTVGKYMQKGSIIVYESTVYPGLTEEECVPILEKESGLKWKKDFNVGYSPERVNPGDKQHTIYKIVKVVAGDTPEITEFLALWKRNNSRNSQSTGHKNSRSSKSYRKYPKRPEHSSHERAFCIF